MRHRASPRIAAAIAAAIAVSGSITPALSDAASDRVWKQLQAGDTAVAQGSFSYRKQPQAQDNSASDEAEIQKLRQKNAKQGLPAKETEKQILQYQANAATAQKNAAAPLLETLTYLPDNRFIRRTTRFVPGSKPQLLTQLYDGEDELLIEGRQVMLLAGRPADLDATQPLIRLYPGACSVLGRGLARLQNVKITSKGKETVVEGKHPDGTFIKAVVDTEHGGIAKRIERKNGQGHLIGRTTLGAPAPSKNGPDVASSALYEAYTADGQLVAKDKYTFETADFTRPPEKLFHFPLTQGLTIVDARLGGVPVVWHKKTAGVMTKAELLQRSTGKLEAQTSRATQVESAGRSESRTRLALLASPILLLAAVLLWRYRQARLLNLQLSHSQASSQ